jgi:adhesin transport system outer membrane protein
MPKLVGQYTNSYSFNAGGAAEGNPVDGVYPTQKTQTVMLVAQWSLNGGTSVAGGLSGIAKEREMNLRALDVRARIEQGIQTGYAAINAAHQREAVVQRSVDADQRVVKDFEEQYKNGGRSLFDMLDAYEQLYNARLNLMRVVIAEAKAAYQVHRQMGNLQQSILHSGEH